MMPLEAVLPPLTRIALDADILIVDDDEAVAPLLALCLEMEGYRVITARRGSDALAYLREGRLPGLVLLDVLMPGLSGLEVLRQLRDNPRTEHLKVALMSGLGDVSDQALESGIPAEFCLPKPVDLGGLRRLVRRVLGAPPE